MNPNLDHRLESAPSPVRAWVNPALHPIGCVGAPVSAGDEAVEEIVAAEEWLIAHGCTRARGPIEGSTFFAYRANMGPMHRPLFLGEPSFDPEPFQVAGYAPIAWYASALADNASQIKNSEPGGSHLQSQGWRLTGLDSLGGFSSALPHLHRLTSASFSDAHSYSPIGRELFEALYAPLETRIDPRLVRFAMSPKDEIAGYCFSIPDLLNPDLRQFIVKTLAVHPKWRRLRLGSWLVGEAHKEAEAAGYSGGGIHALMWSGSHSRSISANGAKLLRHYALFERNLT